MLCLALYQGTILVGRKGRKENWASAPATPCRAEENPRLKSLRENRVAEPCPDHGSKGDHGCESTVFDPSEAAERPASPTSRADSKAQLSVWLCAPTKVVP